MAVYNEILVGRLNNFLKKYLGMKAQAPAPQLSSEIVAGFNIDAGVELRFLQEWSRFGAAINVAPTVGQTNTLRLVNPALSNIIAVIEKISIGVLLAQVVIIGSSQVANGTILSPYIFDPRGQLGSLVQASFTTDSAGATRILAEISLGATSQQDLIFDTNQEITLLPNSGLIITGGLANSNLIASIWWRQRFLEESERA